MSKLQEQIERFSARQIRLFARLARIVQVDLVYMGSALKRLAVKVSGFSAQAFRKTVSNIAPRVGSTAKLLDPIKARVAAGVERPRSGEKKQDLPEFTRVTEMPAQKCIYAIGDVHGRYDLLINLIDQIEHDASGLPDDVEVTIVFLGDYIDRGLQSRQVIELLMGDRLAAYSTVFLVGNHEEALLRFLNDPSFGPKWAQYGGAETLLSYGLQPPRGRASDDPANWQVIWQAFRDALPVEHLEFYRAMKHYYVSGDYLFVHAGLRPNVPLEDQRVQDMLWIREDFLDDQSTFPHLIVHGHTPNNDVYLDNRRMGLDTGAFSSGILASARFINSDISVITT